MGYRIDPVKGLVFESESTVPQGITTQPRNINEMRMQPEMGAAFNQQQTFSVPPGSMQSPQQWDEDLSVTPIMQPPENRVEPMLSENQTGQTRANELRQKYGQPGIFDNYESFQPKPRAASFFDSFNSDYNQRLEKEKGRQATGIANFFSGASIPENQKMPLTMGLLSFGAQLLADSGNNNMFLAQGIGRGLQAGIGGYNAAMTSQQKAQQAQAENQLRAQQQKDLVTHRNNQIEQQRLQREMMTPYYTAQINQMNADAEARRQKANRGKQYREMIPSLIESGVISKDEAAVFNTAGDLYVADEIQRRIEQGPELRVKELERKMLEQQIRDIELFPETIKAFEETGLYSKADIARVKGAGPYAGSKLLKDLKPLAQAPDNMNQSNALGWLSSLERNGMLNPLDTAQLMAFQRAYPLFTYEEVTKDGVTSMVRMPNPVRAPAAFDGFYEALTPKTTSVPGAQGGVVTNIKEPTKDQKDDVEYGTRMIRAFKAIDELMATGYRPSRNVISVLKGDLLSTDQFFDAQDRKFFSNALAFLTAQARKESGAQVGEQERINFVDQYFVNPPAFGGSDLIGNKPTVDSYENTRNLRLGLIKDRIQHAGFAWTDELSKQYPLNFKSPFGDSELFDEIEEDIDNGGTGL